DRNVTGVQTCALPISTRPVSSPTSSRRRRTLTVSWRWWERRSVWPSSSRPRITSASTEFAMFPSPKVGTPSHSRSGGGGTIRRRRWHGWSASSVRSFRRRSERLEIQPRRSLLPADHMGDADLFQAFEAEFETEAGLLHAAEGNPRIHGTVFVDPCRTGLQAGGDLAAGIEVGAPYRGAEPDLEAVGPFDGLLEVRVLDDRQDGAELLLSDERVVIVDVGDER